LARLPYYVTGAHSAQPAKAARGNSPRKATNLISFCGAGESPAPHKKYTFTCKNPRVYTLPLRLPPPPPPPPDDRRLFSYSLAAISLIQPCCCRALFFLRPLVLFLFIYSGTHTTLSFLLVLACRRSPPRALTSLPTFCFLSTFTPAPRLMHRFSYTCPCIFMIANHFFAKMLLLPHHSLAIFYYVSNLCCKAKTFPLWVPNIIIITKEKVFDVTVKYLLFFMAMFVIGHKNGSNL
jgi:hypothetical protein